ncbi:MAG: protein kinase, partial [Candidatus Dormibacteraeota bacterium]|nr:protein kinase [Candidatus Dormibacteraeota bacterium]
MSLTLVANPTSEHGFAVVRDAVSRRLTPLQLEELLGRGAHGDTWRARLTDGSRVAVKRIFSVGEDPSAFFQRLERASAVHHANLLEVIRTLEESGELWVVSRLGTGVPLDTLLKGGRIRSGCAVAVGMGILSGLTALHQAGLWHGSVHGRNVHVDLDGTVRLGDHCLSPAPAGLSSAALRAADVRAAGALICSMLRVPLESAPATGQRQALKVASSPLGLAAKTIAGPPRKLPAGYEAAHASLTLWEAARKMATSRRQAQARHDLATMVMAALGAPRPTVVQTPGERQAAQRARRPASNATPAPAAPLSDPPATASPAPSARGKAQGNAVPPAARPAASAATAPGRPAERLELPPPPQRGQAPAPRLEPAPIADRAPPVDRVAAARPAASVSASAIGLGGSTRPARPGVPWSLLGLLAAALLIGVCVLMAVASAMPVNRRAPTQLRPAPTQTGPAPTAAAPAAPSLPSYGDVPVTTPIVAVPAAP